MLNPSSRFRRSGRDPAAASRLATTNTRSIDNGNAPRPNRPETSSDRPGRGLATDGTSDTGPGRSPKPRPRRRPARACRARAVSAIRGEVTASGTPARRETSSRRAYVTNGRRHVQPDDVAPLLHEERVGGRLERLAEVRLQPGGAPEARDGGLGQAQFARQTARAPVGGVLGPGLRGSADGALDLLVGNGARDPGARLVGQAGAPRGGEAVAPLADGRQGDAQVVGKGGVGRVNGGGQDKARPQGQGRGPGGPRREFGPLVVGQGDRGRLGPQAGVGSSWRKATLSQLYR